MDKFQLTGLMTLANHYRKEMKGAVYHNFEGGKFMVADIAVDANRHRLLVVYKDIRCLDYVWVLPLDDFLSEVDHGKYPGVKQEQRFERMT